MHDARADLVMLARNPVPSSPVVGRFQGEDGAIMRFARWEATRGPGRGTVVLIPGRGEFIEKYFEVIADLRRRGFAVAIQDLRGQGGSARPLADRNKGHIRDFLTYDQDLLRFMKDVVLPDCPPPFVALGHSLGGHILLRNATSLGSWFERMILIAPMLALADEKVGFPQGLVRFYAEAATLLGLGRRYVLGGSGRPEESVAFEKNILTSDRERWARSKMVVDQAPELGLGSPTIAWLRAAYRSMALLKLPDYPARVQVPILMFASGEDHIVSTRAIEEFAYRLKLGTHVMISHARHEILQERDEIRQRFWATFDAYLGVTEPTAGHGVARAG